MTIQRCSLCDIARGSHAYHLLPRWLHISVVILLILPAAMFHPMLTLALLNTLICFQMGKKKLERPADQPQVHALHCTAKRMVRRHEEEVGDNDETSIQSHIT